MSAQGLNGVQAACQLHSVLVMARYIEISTYRFRYRYIISYNRKRHHRFFRYYRDILIYRDISSINIGIDIAIFGQYSIGIVRKLKC